MKPKCERKWRVIARSIAVRTYWCACCGRIKRVFNYPHRKERVTYILPENLKLERRKAAREPMSAEEYLR